MTSATFSFSHLCFLESFYNALYLGSDNIGEPRMKFQCGSTETSYGVISKRITAAVAAASA